MIFIAFSIEVSDDTVMSMFNSLSPYIRSFHFREASCLHTIHLGEEIAWKPSCEIDGSFAAKQCRGDKLTGRFRISFFHFRRNMNNLLPHWFIYQFIICLRCFCYAASGEKIFGWEWWKDADNMTCKCSRQRYTAERSGRLDVTLHCLPNGNFEALQCDMGICWCADEQSGFIQPDTVAVPDNLWTFLPCCKFKLMRSQW